MEIVKKCWKMSRALSPAVEIFGKKKPDLVCTKPGFSILKSGVFHWFVDTNQIDEFDYRILVVT